MSEGAVSDQSETAAPGLVWDGVTRPEPLSEWARAARQRIADCGRTYDWSGLLSAVEQHPRFVNAARPGGRSLYAPLHQAAHGGAPVAVVERLLALGSWRTLRTADGERPVDIAARRGHTHLTALLTPVLLRSLPAATLAVLQEHLHAVIRGRAEPMIREYALRLPELEVLLELPTPGLRFPVPGMYGGFGIRLDAIDGDPVLIVESWSRIVDGSGQRHVISPHGSLLVAEGFV